MKNFSAETLLLYAVTDRAWTGKTTLLEQIEAALAGGVTLLQLREKDMPEDDPVRPGGGDAGYLLQEAAAAEQAVRHADDLKHRDSR